MYALSSKKPGRTEFSYRMSMYSLSKAPKTQTQTLTAVSWLPGDDYYVNFHEGDPFIKVDEGYARLAPAMRPFIQNSKT